MEIHNFLDNFHRFFKKVIYLQNVPFRLQIVRSDPSKGLRIRAGHMTSRLPFAVAVAFQIQHDANRLPLVQEVSYSN